MFGIFLVWIVPGVSEKMSLEEVVEEVVKNNPEILAYKEKWKSAKNRIPQARWWNDPQFSIGFEEIPEESYILGDARMRMYSVSQLIPFPGKLTLMGKIAGKDADIAKELYKEKKNEIIAKVKSIYYSLFFIHKAIEIHKETKELIKKFAKIAETKYTVGEVSQHDVLKAQVELSLIIDELITIEKEKLPAKETELNTILNRSPHSPLGVPEEFGIPKLKYTKKELEELAFLNRPKLRAIKYMVEKDNYALILAKMQYLPDFMVKIKQEEMLMPMGTETTRGVMFSMNIPLWFWKKWFKIKEKHAKKRSTELSYQAMRNKVLFEVQDALAKFRASERRVNLFKTSIIPQAEQVLKSATIAYETGKVDFLTLMESERMLREAKLKYYRALATHGINLANLERVVGISLTEQ